MPAQALSVALALVAACSNATSNILQRMANREETGVRTLSLTLVKDLLRRPLWLAGVGAVTLSFVLQASALRYGPLALVEPLIVAELPLTFVGAAVVLRAPLGRREWTAAVVMAGGLAALVGLLDPSGGNPGSVPAMRWAIGLALCGGAVVALVVAGVRRRGDRRAALYGVATGIQFGVTAALMKGAVASLAGGVGAVFGAWETYAMVAAGIGGMFLLQNALQAGKIVAAQPGITLLDPFVAIVWGVFAFGEQPAPGAVRLGLALAGGLVMVAGAVLLSRSPVLEHRREAPSQAGVRRTSDAA
jgi:drug/metabolite transporter (DMT)-like permease